MSSTMAHQRARSSRTARRRPNQCSAANSRLREMRARGCGSDNNPSSLTRMKETDDDRPDDNLPLHAAEEPAGRLGLAAVQEGRHGAPYGGGWGSGGGAVLAVRGADHPREP